MQNRFTMLTTNRWLASCCCLCHHLRCPPPQTHTHTQYVGSCWHHGATAQHQVSQTKLTHTRLKDNECTVKAKPYTT
jgi:hypothetical protein